MNPNKQNFYVKLSIQVVDVEVNAKMSWMQKEIVDESNLKSLLRERFLRASNWCRSLKAFAHENRFRN